MRNDWLLEMMNPKCPECGRAGYLNSWADYSCSPEHRREHYIKVYGWKEPEDPTGWYVAEFKSPADTKNISPEEIRKHNDKITNAPEVVRTNKERLTDIERVLKEIDTQIYVLERDNEELLSVYNDEKYEYGEVSYDPQDLRELADRIETTQAKDEYKRYKILKDQVDQLKDEKERCERTIEETTWYLRAKPLRPNH